MCAGCESVISKVELDEMYWDRGMSQLEITNEIGVSQMTVSNWMRKYGIKSRTNSESKLGNAVKPSKENLEDMYF